MKPYEISTQGAWINMQKLIIRADDVGYTDVCNIGTFETFHHGYATTADVMLDAPGIEDALRRLRDMPWISVGWHTHFWGSCVLEPSQVKTLVIPGTNRFRHDLRNAQDVDEDEIMAECSAQVDRCVEILGRAPDVGVDQGEGSPFARALKATSLKYGMATNYGVRLHRDPATGDVTYDPLEGRFKDKLFIADNRNLGGLDLQETFRGVHDLYDGVDWLLKDTMKIHELPEGAALMHGFHPGYVDYYVAHQGDYGPMAPLVTVTRAYDVEALCSQRLHDWIKENNIELCNIRDALYGTHEYQNHLRAIGSDLCVY